MILVRVAGVTEATFQETEDGKGGEKLAMKSRLVFQESRLGRESKNSDLSLSG